MYAEDLSKGAKNVVDPNKRLPALTERYNRGDRSFDFMRNYIEVLYGAREEKKAEQVAMEFVSNTPITKFDDKDMFQILALSKIKYGSSNYWYLVNMEEYLMPLVGSEKYFQVLDVAIKNYLYDKAENGKSLEELEAAILETKQDRANPYFQQRIEKNLRYAYYLAKDDVSKWVDLKLAEAESLKGSQEYVFFVHDIGAEMVNNPKLDNAKEAYDKVLKVGHQIADHSNGVIMGSFMLAKLYLKTGNKEQALKYFNLFFENNGAVGGNNTHVTVTDLKKDLDNL